LRVPLLALHGNADNVVAPRNAVALVRQYLRLNGYPPGNTDTDPSRMPPADAERRTVLAGGRIEVVSEWRREGRLVARYVEIIGLGHAWSGGDPALPYNDAGPPDATALVGDFFADALSSRTREDKRWPFPE
jgi:poly(3-hydroxybutyrate) depolymerase